MAAILHGRDNRFFFPMGKMFFLIIFSLFLRYYFIDETVGILMLADILPRMLCNQLGLLSAS